MSSVKHPGAAEPLIQLFEELRQLTVRAGRDDLTNRLGMARTRVSDPRVRVVVVGEPKQGMSTLVNGLVGAEVTATNSAAGIPVVLEHGDVLGMALIRSGSGGKTERRPVDPRDPIAALEAAPEGVLRAEATLPSPLLAEGVVLIDAPGVHAHDPTRTAATLSMLAAADAALYVSEAGKEYSAEELTYLQQIQQICPAVICVLNKIDMYPHWSDVQQRNRRLLDSTGLNFAIFPVSAGMRDYANRNGDRQLDVESGVPQLVDYLREQVIARADAVAREAVRGDVRAISDHLAMSLRAESESLRDPRRSTEVTERLRTARDNAERLRRRSANWQVALSDGCTELMTDIEHDLRHRLRTLLRAAEADIGRARRGDPTKRWEEFAVHIDKQISDAVAENFVDAHNRSAELADQVAAKFPTEGQIVSLPELQIDDATGVLDPVQPLERLESAKGGFIALFLASLRGYYGGMLMIGLATSLMKMPIVNYYSAGAGALLAIQALWEERRNRKQRRQAEAKVAVGRLMDDVIFQVSKESRFRLRAVQRTLRDHFTEIANETMRSAEDALRSAEDANTQHQNQRADRLVEIDDHLDRLRRLQLRADSLAAAGL